MGSRHVVVLNITWAIYVERTEIKISWIKRFNHSFWLCSLPICIYYKGISSLWRQQNWRLPLKQQCTLFVLICHMLPQWGTVSITYATWWTLELLWVSVDMFMFSQILLSFECFGQISPTYSCSFTPHPLLWCDKFILCTKVWPHLSHWWGFFPVCLFKWLLLSPL